MYTYEFEGQWVPVYNLPQRFRLADGTTRTDLKSMTDEELEAIGIYKVTVTTPTYDSATEMPVPGEITVVDGVAAMTQTIASLPTPVPPSRILTRLAFLDRFSVQELTTLYTAAPASPQIQVWLDMYRVSDEINLDDPRLVAGVEGLESAGILSVGRAAEVLA